VIAAIVFTLLVPVALASDPVATFRRDGVEVRLTIKRGTETIEKRLRLRRLA